MKNHARKCVYLGLVLVLALFSNPALAATIVVDETTCTLVDAITAANTDSAVGGCVAGSGSDTIVLMTDVTLTTVDNYALGNDNGLPLVTSEIEISGGGFVIQRAFAAPPFRILAVDAAGKLEIDAATLRNGLSGALRAGGIQSEGVLILTNSTITANETDFGPAGIYNFGSATVDYTTITSNIGSGIRNLGLLTITNSTVSDNTRKGILHLGDEMLIVENSTVSGNLYPGLDNRGPARVTNSTLSGNPAGITNFGTMAVENTSVMSSIVYGVTVEPGSTLRMANSIVSDSSFDDNCRGTIIDEGNNFSNDDTCGPGFASIDPGVDYDTVLADNGGPTLTHALLPWSVAIDAAGECDLETDQRGFPRSDGACDSGSFEFQAGTGTPASSRVGVLVGIALVMIAAWAVLRPRLGGRHPT